NDLDSIIETLDSGNQNYLPTKFESNGKTYYSVLVNACGWINVEFFGDSQSKFVDSELTVMEDRMVFEDYNTLMSGSWITPLKVSRATNKIDEVETYYTEILGATVIKSKTYDDGYKRLVL
ncbi:MAG: hypothetical protein H8E12_11400, partial [Rhodobacteraceae bacterium]|nr:hypothetical protein [Paracoccaceae bacterium]